MLNPEELREMRVQLAPVIVQVDVILRQILSNEEEILSGLERFPNTKRHIINILEGIELLSVDEQIARRREAGPFVACLSRFLGTERTKS